MNSIILVSFTIVITIINNNYQAKINVGLLFENMT